MLKWDKYETTEFEVASKKLDEAQQNYEQMKYITKAEGEK